MRQLIACFLVAWMVPAHGAELAAAKASFAAKDKALNAVYTDLKKALRPELFSRLQEDQRAWISYRDYISDGQAGGGKPQESAERWETAAEMTASRIDWLKAWKKLDQRKGWGGMYSDSRGGTLMIAEKEGKHWFALDVVRGPTFHLGNIGGEFRVNGSTGWFEVKADGEKDPTWLTFIESPDQQASVQVTGENTGYFHGARARFDGLYVWMGELSAEDQKKVREGKTDDR